MESRKQHCIYYIFCNQTNHYPSVIIIAIIVFIAEEGGRRSNGIIITVIQAEAE